MRDFAYSGPNYLSAGDGHVAAAVIVGVEDALKKKAGGRS
jgi:hypothetical protein